MELNIKVEVFGEEILVQTNKKELLNTEGKSINEKVINLIIESIKIGEIFNNDGDLIDKENKDFIIFKGVR